MQMAYWRRVAARAWHDTLLAFGLTSRQRAVTKLLVAAAAVAIIGYFGGEAAAKPKLLTTLATAGAFSLVFALVFLWNVILTPAKLDDDEKKIERDLRAQVDQKNQAAEKQAAIDDLAEERLKH